MAHRPSLEKRSVSPRRRPNAELRTREYLTDAEIARLTESAKKSRHGHRDATMIGSPSTHPIEGDELRALRQFRRAQEPKSPFVFTSRWGSPFTPNGVARMIERAGDKAGLGFKAHPHMLRHACGYARAHKGHDAQALQSYLSLKNIEYAVRYTKLPPDQFKDFWRS
jgi:integrase